MTFPNVDLAKCPRCDKYNYLAELINCSRCDTWYYPKKKWLTLFSLNENYMLVFNYGKYKGKLLRDHPEYLLWLRAQDISVENAKIIDEVMQNL